MTIDEYREEYDAAPLMLYEFAQAARNVDDDEDFKNKATAYLVAMEEFEDALAERDIEMG